MARKTLKISTRITRLDAKYKPTGYTKVAEETVNGTVITTLASSHGVPIVMIDKDPAQRYTIMLRDMLEAVAIAGLREKIKGERKHANTRRD